MAQNPELHLWRAVLLVALSSDDAERWIMTKDGATVCSLAGVERDAVVRAMRAGLPPQTGTGRKRAA